MVTLIAFVSMFIDHMGLIFFPGEEIYRSIGRLAFPLFAWGIVRGYKMTRNKQNYAKRIFILALISQIPVFFLFGNQMYNICFTLFAGLASIALFEQKHIHVFIKSLLFILILGVAYFLSFDYGIYGILTIVLLQFFWQQKKSIIYFLGLTLLFYTIDYKNLSFSFHYQLYAPVALVLLYMTPLQKYDFPINKTFKYLFYPLHLMILYLIYLNW